MHFICPHHSISSNFSPATLRSVLLSRVCPSDSYHFLPIVVISPIYPLNSLTSNDRHRKVLSSGHNLGQVTGQKNNGVKESRVGGGNKDRGLEARGPLAPNTNPEEAQEEKEQAAEAQHPVVAHSPAGQGGASVEAGSVTLTHPGVGTWESRCPSFALYYSGQGVEVSSYSGTQQGTSLSDEVLGTRSEPG